ncbi:MAG: peptidoglycan DD-metalloendopeptidase family protein, partial [Candidatus Taylorbacteria bacterium]
MNMSHYYRCALCIIIGGIIGYSSILSAQTTSDIQAQRDQKVAEQQALLKEIQGYQNQLNTLSGQADSLANTIKSLDLTEKKLNADIKVSENKITVKNSEITQLTGQISDKEGSIADDKRIIKHSFGTLGTLDGRSIPEIILGSQSLSEGLNAFDQFGSLQQSLYDRINSLNQTKQSLETNRTKSQKAKKELESLNAELKSQRTIIRGTTAEKNSLLAQTKQSESSYKQILATRQAQADALQREIDAYESQLHFNVNRANLPHTGSGVLSWPLDNPIVTQYFGNTSFSATNPQIYKGQGHNGVDFRASIGTPVHAALGGQIVGVSNTSAIVGCYSYGKWIMIKHPNGLSTLYAHISLQNVS